MGNWLCLPISFIFMERSEKIQGFHGGSDGKESFCNAGNPNLILGQKDPLKKGIATHSSILAWKTPWTEEPGGLHSPWGHKELDTTKRLTL